MVCNHHSPIEKVIQKSTNYEDYAQWFLSLSATWRRYSLWVNFYSFKVKNIAEICAKTELSINNKSLLKKVKKNVFILIYI